MQELIAADGHGHVVRVRTNQRIVLVKKQVDALGNLRLLFARRELGQPLGHTALVDGVDEGDALHRVDTAEGDKARRAQEDGADACLQRPFRVLRENLGSQPDDIVLVRAHDLPPAAR